MTRTVLSADWVNHGLNMAPDNGGYQTFSTRLRGNETLEVPGITPEAPPRRLRGPAYVDVIRMPNGAIVVERH